MNMTKKFKMFAIAWAVAFLAFQITFFVLYGFKGHTPTLWVSWFFMSVAFVVEIVFLTILNRRNMLLKNWFFGYPLVRYSVVYFALETIFAIAFVLLENIIFWQVAFGVQVLLLVIYLLFMISGLVAKESIDEVHEKVSDKAQFMKLLRADTEMLCEKCEDASVKAKCKKVAELVRYSDPVSHEALAELEQEIALAVKSCNEALAEKKYEEADKLCDKVILLLTERSKKCKTLK